MSAHPLATWVAMQVSPLRPTPPRRQRRQHGLRLLRRRRTGAAATTAAGTVAVPAPRRPVNEPANARINRTTTG